MKVHWTETAEAHLDAIYADIDQIREVFCGPYRIIYHIKPDQVDVIAVVHSAMNVLQHDNK